MKRAATLVAALALVLPPMPVAARGISVSICGQPGARMVLPVKPLLPYEGDDHGCCKKGCHAANERKKRGAGAVDDSGDDNCC
jgi:hypothetical protein